MDLYSFVELAAERAEINLTHSGKEKIVGNLRVAGFNSLENSEDRQIAFKIVSQKLTAFVGTPKFKKRYITAASEKGAANEFDAIKEMKDKGICPKCKTDAYTSNPKVRNGEKVLYCNNCRVTLWMD